MKRIVLGIVAHVDSGKTTLSENLLYRAGTIREMGRVDHKNTFLDTDRIERDRGITIYSKQAMLSFDDCEITLIDTPGHIDFSGEAERTLKILDYAVLVISSKDVVNSHTKSIWKLLRENSIPTFIFVNKMDLENQGKDTIINSMQNTLSSNVVDFSDSESLFDKLALCDEEMLEEYLSSNSISRDKIKISIKNNNVFPCFFGSALKNEGVDELVGAIKELSLENKYSKSFGAKVYKITEDEKGRRLTHLKVTGDKLSVRDIVEINGNKEKINEIRVYSGNNYNNVDYVTSGDVCSVLGLNSSYAGLGLGIEKDFQSHYSEALFSYSVKLIDGTDIIKAYEVFKRLEEEESSLNCTLSHNNTVINIRIMGDVQLEVLKNVLKEKYSLDVEFEHGRIVYKETIRNKIEGVGHYEPLRHYSEVHLLIEPAERGKGIVIANKCNDEMLDKAKQNLVISHILEKKHKGVLIGAELTDVKITLVSGKAHKKHTEGGDFREATYRAIRQGLMSAESVLLEPWYSFSLEIPYDFTGRAMTDLEMMGARYEQPIIENEISKITGICPVSKMQDYRNSVISYSKGAGRLFCEFFGYEECVNTDEIVNLIGYNAEADLENSPDSIFCAHGGGFLVKWNEVYDYMHIPLINEEKPIEEPIARERVKKIIADEKELLSIFEMTYGKVQHKTAHTVMRTQKEVVYKAKPIKKKEKYLLIDGYNIIHSWEELTKISKSSLDDAREVLISKITTYRAMKAINIILVFDAYKVSGGVENSYQKDGINIVYTKEAETADSYIERTTSELNKNYQVSVATSDGMEQIIIFGNGAVRVTPQELLKEVEEVEKEIRDFIKNNNQ